MKCKQTDNDNMRLQGEEIKEVLNSDQQDISRSTLMDQFRTTCPRGKKKSYPNYTVDLQVEHFKD